MAKNTITLHTRPLFLRNQEICRIIRDPKLAFVNKMLEIGVINLGSPCYDGGAYIAYILRAYAWGAEIFDGFF